MSARPGRPKPPATLDKGWSAQASSQSPLRLRDRSPNTKPLPSTSATVPAYQDARDIEDAQSAVPNSVKVHACGQNLEVSFSESMSLVGLQMALSSELKMPSQVFEICDARGMSICNDDEFLGAVSMGYTPLVASLPEVSIHLIENRREELSQMQWKLVRDQLTGLGEKICSIGHGLEELTDRLSVQKNEQEANSTRFRSEMTGLIDNVQDHGRQNIVRLEERLEAVLQVVHLERSAREAAKQSLERQFQGLRDILESERSTRRSDSAVTASVMEECRSSILEEARERAAMEERLVRDSRNLVDRLDALSRSQTDTAADLCERVQQVSQETNRDVRESTRQVLQDRASNESLRNEMSVKVQLMEERMTTLESRQREYVNRQGGQLEDMWSKFDSMQQLVEQARLEERAKSFGLRKKLKASDEYDDQQKPSEAPCQEMIRSPSAPGTLLRSQQRAPSPSPMSSPTSPARIQAVPASSSLNLSGPMAMGNGSSLSVSQAPTGTPSHVSMHTGATSTTSTGYTSPPGPLRPVPIRETVSPVITAGTTRPGLMRPHLTAAAAAGAAKPGSMRAPVSATAAAAAAGAVRSGSLQAMRHGHNSLQT